MVARSPLLTNPFLSMQALVCLGSPQYFFMTEYPLKQYSPGVLKGTVLEWICQEYSLTYHAFLIEDFGFKVWE
jgi:hypothetical protein